MNESKVGIQNAEVESRKSEYLTPLCTPASLHLCTSCSTIAAIEITRRAFHLRFHQALAFHQGLPA